MPEFKSAIIRVTTCLGSLETSVNLKHVTELSGKKYCHGKVSKNCSFVFEYLHFSQKWYIATYINVKN